MFKPHKGICSCHGKERWLVNKKGECNELRKEKSIARAIANSSKGNTSKPSVLRRGWGHKADVKKAAENNGKSLRVFKTKTFRKPTGEANIFREIWNERDPWCEWCGVGIIDFNVANYHHLKPKSKFPELRLVKENIVKICFNCHFKEHNG